MLFDTSPKLRGRMRDRSQIHSTGTRAMSMVMVLIGIALLIRTLLSGGGATATGVVLGVLFMLAGGGRLYLQLRRP